MRIFWANSLPFYTFVSQNPTIVSHSLRILWALDQLLIDPHLFFPQLVVFSLALQTCRCTPLLLNSHNCGNNEKLPFFCHHMCSHSVHPRAAHSSSLWFFFSLYLLCFKSIFAIDCSSLASFLLTFEGRIDFRNLGIKFSVVLRISASEVLFIQFLFISESQKDS